MLFKIFKHLELEVTIQLRTKIIDTNYENIKRKKNQH